MPDDRFIQQASELLATAGLNADRHPTLRRMTAIALQEARREEWDAGFEAGVTFCRRTLLNPADPADDIKNPHASSKGSEDG